MDFGKLAAFSEVDFTFKEDNDFNTIALKKTNEIPNIYVGPPIWSNREWLGKIYPTKAKEAEFLYYYSQQFNTIELNVTHYQIPNPNTINRWKESSATGFKFCPKFPQSISHERQLIGCEAITNQFCESISALGNKLGRTFLQLNQGFDLRRFKVLEAYLKTIPSDFPVNIEFRHPSWFQDIIGWQETLSMLHSRQIGTVMSDVAGRRDVLHLALSNDTFMLRFVGNELHQTDFTRIDAWVQKIKKWLQDGLKTAYIFVHCGENTLAPELANYWIEALNLHCGINIEPAKIKPRVVQGSLF
jgi:uncharacterized protein YecE (DUF72 family)